MKKLLAAAAFACAALAGCSSHPSTPAATSDEAMAREFSSSVDGIDYDDLAHPDDFVFGVTQIARTTCGALDSMHSMGELPDAPTEVSKAAFAAMIRAAIHDSDITEQQQRDKMRVSAKYRCPQYSAPLKAHFDAVPVSPPGR